MLTSPKSSKSGGKSARNGPKRAAIGLREVLKQSQRSAVAVVLFAADIEGAVRDKLGKLIGSITEACAESGTLVVFALTRDELSRALGKTGNISCVGLLHTAVTAVDLGPLRALMAEAYAQA